MPFMAEPADPEPRTSDFLDQYLESAPAADIEKPRHARQGLPSAYRMRHDAHYVDELEARRRPADPSPTASGRSVAEPSLIFPTSIPVTFALRDISDELDGVASCFNLIGAKARPLRERLGLTMARVGIQRSSRAFQALRVLLEDPAPDLEPVAVGTVIAQAVASLDDEIYLTGATARLRLGESPSHVRADARLLSLALLTCAGALIAFIEASGRGGALEASVSSVAGFVCCEMHQDACRVAPEQLARLTDLEWTDRPGGMPAGIGLAAAARIAQAHGGQLEARRRDSGGIALSLRLPV
jgi:hypothetical protein